MPGIALVARIDLAGTMQLTQRAGEILNLAFVVDFLALREFQRLQHFLHFIERTFQFLDHPIDLVNGVRDGRSAVGSVVGIGAVILAGFRPGIAARFAALLRAGLGALFGPFLVRVI